MEKRLKNLKLVATLAMLSAISIICGKYLAINGGNFMRFSLENMPIIFAGMAFGPIAGAVVGVVADLIGCVLMGWVPIPWVTVGAAFIGIIAGVANPLMKKYKVPAWLITTIVVFCAHLIGSVLIKTIGLSSFYNMQYSPLLLWRLLNYLVVGIIDGFVVHFLLKNKAIKMQLKKIGGKE